MTGLRELNLNYTNVSADTVCAFGGLVNLESLALCGTDITDECLRVISQLPRLNKLYVSGAQVSDDGVAALRASNTIQVLDISYCKNVGDDGIESLSTLPLWSLNTVGTRVSEQGKEMLRGAIPSLSRIH
jgi:hypothetical protein